jgi:hypothetical protein
MNSQREITLIPTIILSIIIITGCVLIYNDSAGRPLALPGSGFLIAHTLLNISLRKTSLIIKVLGSLLILIILTSIVLIIESSNGDIINYNAFKVCIISAFIWFIIEIAYLKFSKGTEKL